MEHQTSGHRHNPPPIKKGKLRRRELWLLVAPLLFLGFFCLPKIYFYFKPVEVTIGLNPEDFGGWGSLGDASNATKVIMKRLYAETERPICSQARVFIVRWDVGNQRPGRGGPRSFEMGRYVYIRPEGTLNVERTSYTYRDIATSKWVDVYSHMNDDILFRAVEANEDHEFLADYGATHVIHELQKRHHIRPDPWSQ